jgi:hypothetical protein
MSITNPRQVVPIIDGATYFLPTYKVGNNGISDGDGLQIQFCKGNKADETALRQEGVFTESLIELARQYLTSVNVGELATRETSMAITKLDEALMWIDKRAKDRELRNVQGTYQK